MAEKIVNSFDTQGVSAETITRFRQAFDLVLRDAPTEHIDAVFFHSLSHGDDSEMFPPAASFINEGRANYIVVNGSNGEKLDGKIPGEAWSGKDEYIRRLISLGVDRNKIILTAPAFHTRQANDALLQTAMDHGWRSAVTLNQPQQLLRAQLGQIKTMEKAGYWMRLYTSYPEPWDATKPVFGQQGAAQQRRVRLIGPEFDRIIAYQQKGDIATFDEFSAYIARRPKIE